MKTAICAVFFKTHRSYFGLQVVELVRWMQDDSLLATCTRCTLLAFALHWFSNTESNWNGKMCVCVSVGRGEKPNLYSELNPKTPDTTRNSELVLVAELCACAAFCLPLYGTVNLVRLPAHALPLCWPKARVMFLWRLSHKFSAAVESALLLQM